jgi:hypothetical protein
MTKTDSRSYISICYPYITSVRDTLIHPRVCTNPNRVFLCVVSVFQILNHTQGDPSDTK